jgi:hypothetical protein
MLNFNPKIKRILSVVYFVFMAAYFIEYFFEFKLTRLPLIVGPKAFLIILSLSYYIIVLPTAEDFKKDKDKRKD